MTLRQVIKRIEEISLAHKQIRSFFYNVNLVEWLNEKEAKYPAVFLQDNGGIISTVGNATTIDFKLFVMDLVNVSEDTKINELDVVSDMLSVVQDLIAQFNHFGNDWYFSTDNAIQPVVEGDNDMHAGIVLDFSIRLSYTQNVCAIPTTFADYEPPQTGDDMNVYDLEYIADGTEGVSLTIPALSGKKIIFISRESGVLYKVSNSPDTAEYTWDGTTITLGLATIAGARFLILYRNF